MLVTIVTVVLNNKLGLDKTLTSYRDYINFNDNCELIVIDGGSTDGTLESVANNSDIIKFFTSEKDSGIYDAMNKGILKANGKFVWFVNSGDEILFNPEAELISWCNSKVAYHCFPVLLEETNAIYRGGRTWPHQGIIYNRRLFSLFGLYEDYKLISDRLFYDVLTSNSVHRIVHDTAICKFASDGISSRSNAAYINVSEFSRNFIKKRDINSFIRLMIAMYILFKIRK